ncbi:MAG: glycoside hydrolase family 16 protein, partial [Woeseia sp.]
MLRPAALITALFLVTACSQDNRPVPLSGVQVIDIPAANPGPQVNQNISNPTLNIPETFPVADGDQLTLVWREEFNGPAIDPQVWFFATGDGAEKGLQGWGNNELQYYLPDNAQIVNGALEITARRETVGAFDYTSARINTEDRFAFKYGRIEARIKLPAGQGIWPAFWMLSQDSPYGSWAATGEIDIMEAVNLGGTGGNQIFGTLHYGGEAPANTFTSETYTPSVNVTEDYHTYAVEWDEFEFRWYFDGQLYAVQNSWFSSAAPYPAPFDQPFHILLNVAVGGNFPGSPNATTVFPVTMQVDWVRVYSGEEPSGPPPAAADPGIIPDDVIYASDPNETVDIVFGVDYADFSPFGSGSVFNNNVTTDADFNPAFGVTTGNGYGAQVGQFAIVGFATGFASGYA